MPRDHFVAIDGPSSWDVTYTERGELLSCYSEYNVLRRRFDENTAHHNMRTADGNLVLS